MDLEQLCGKMVESTRGITIMGKKKARALIRIQMVGGILVSGWRVCNMDTDKSIFQMGRSNADGGLMARRITLLQQIEPLIGWAIESMSHLISFTFVFLCTFHFSSLFLKLIDCFIFMDIWKFS
jgi:hypothetical protein